MSNYGYNFYFQIGEELLLFPITPSEVTINVGSKNKVVTLIGEGDINVLKSPSLIEVDFEARFPIQPVPYARDFSDFETYWNKLKDLKENKKYFRFIIARTTPGGDRTWDTDLLMALEEMKISESVENGNDVLIKFKLKQYKEYGIKVLPSESVNDGNSGSESDSTSSPTTSTSEETRPTDGHEEKSYVYTVKTGDCLWSIARRAYGDGSKYKQIYEANKEAIEADARRHGKASASNGYLIWAGLKLTIPGISDASKL